MGKFNNTKKKGEKEMKAQKDSVKAELRNNLLVTDRNRVLAQKSEIRVLDFAPRNEFSA